MIVCQCPAFQTLNQILFLIAKTLISVANAGVTAKISMKNNDPNSKLAIAAMGFEIAALHGLISANIEQVQAFIKKNVFDSSKGNLQELISFNTSQLYLIDSLLMLKWVTFRKINTTLEILSLPASEDTLAEYQIQIESLYQLKSDWIAALAQLILEESKIEAVELNHLLEEQITKLLLAISSICNSFSHPHFYIPITYSAAAFPKDNNTNQIDDKQLLVQVMRRFPFSAKTNRQILQQTIRLISSFYPDSSVANDNEPQTAAVRSKPLIVSSNQNNKLKNTKK